MTDHPCNCGTCTHKNCDSREEPDGKPHMLPEYIQVYEVGCLSHSGAMDYLINQMGGLKNYEKERERLLNLLDRFVKDSINICDEPHGKLSSSVKIKGMKMAFICMEGMLRQCRTEDGIKLLEESLQGEL